MKGPRSSASANTAANSPRRPSNTTAGSAGSAGAAKKAVTATTATSDMKDPATLLAPPGPQGPSSRSSTPSSQVGGGGGGAAAIDLGAYASRQSSPLPPRSSESAEGQKQEAQLPDSNWATAPTGASHYAAAAPVSVRPSLEFSEHVDTEPLRHLHENLDKWAGLMKSAIVSDFMSMSREHLAEIGRLRELQGGKLDRFRGEMSALTQMLEQAQRSLDRKERILEEIVLQPSFGPHKSLLKRAFQYWHVRCVKAGSVTSTKFVFSNHIAKQHARKVLAKKVMNAWTQEVMKYSWKKRLVREAKTSFQEELKLVRQEYEAKLTAMREEKTALDAQLETLAQDRARYAEEMKQALLRGVCALNIETMSVFGQQGQGSENLPDLSTSKEGVDPLPFAPEPELPLRPSPLKTTLPLKDSTWLNQQQQQQQHQQQPSGAYVLPHRHVSDYAALHQPPPPPPSLFRYPNPGSLHVNDQYAASAYQDPPSTNQHGSAGVELLPQPLSGVRMRSPDHKNVHHNYRIGGAAPATTGRTSGARPSGRVVRPSVDQVQKGPVGMLMLQQKAKPSTFVGSSSAASARGIRVERHQRG